MDADPIVVLGFDRLLVGQVRKIQAALFIDGLAASQRGQKAKGKSRKWVLYALRLHRGGQKAKGKSRKWVLNAFRHHTGGQKAEGKSGKWVLNALRLHTGGHLLPFTFCLLAFRVLLQSAIQNAKSRIQNHVSALQRS